MKLQTSPPYSGASSRDDSLAAALEKAKVKVQQMVKKRHQEEANIDSEPLYPTHKKSRVVPKSSRVLQSETVSSRRLEGDSPSADADRKKKSDSSAATDVEDVEDGNHRDGTNAEAVVSTAQSQKNDAEPSEANKAKKSLPFIGKLPFLKAARTAKQTASEQSAADDKSKIEIKLNVGQALSTPVQDELTPSSSDAESIPAQELNAVPDWSVSVTRSTVESSSTARTNSLDAFLSIGDPESGQSQAVPVLNVGPQTRSEFMLENQLDGTKTSSKVAATGSTASPGNNKGELAAVKAAVTDKVADVKHSSTVPAGNSSNDVMTISVAETPGTLIPSVSGEHDANSSGVLAATDTECTDLEDDSAMFIDIDDNTEDYEAGDNAESEEQVAQLARNEETAQLLPEISATWMKPAASSGSSAFCALALLENFPPHEVPSPLIVASVYISGFTMFPFTFPAHFQQFRSSTFTLLVPTLPL